MPCGQLDRRRVGHRCGPCKKSHAKCDGGRPCSICRVRGLECANSKTASNFQFVHQGESKAVPRVLIQDSWRYISSYFQAFGPLTQASVLRSDTVTALSHDNEDVSRTLSIMGAFYACRNPSTLRINAKEKQSIMGTWMKHKTVIAKGLKKPESSNISPVLLSALLLAIVELMVVEEPNSFQGWLERISDFLQSHSRRRDISSWTPFEKELVRFFEFLGILSAISRNDTPFKPFVTSEPSPTDRIALGPVRGIDVSSDATKLDGMLSTMWHWAMLLPKMHLWICHAGQQLPSQESGEMSKELVDLKVRGLDIVCDASALQSRMIENLLQLSQEPQAQATISISPYYQWALTGLCQLLQHDVWKSLTCDLPVMPAEVRHQQALVALGCIETLIDQLGLDLALYLPFATYIGVEMRTVAEQQRMLRFLDTVKCRGFGVADEFRENLLEQWKPVREESHE